jgi:hypothetical protein
MYDFGSIYRPGRRCLCEWRLAAPRLGSGANTNADSYAYTHTDSYTGAKRRMHDAKSVRVDGHRRLRERRVAVWLASAGTDSHANSDSDSSTGTGAKRRMHHAKSVRIDGHRHLREWRLDFCRTAFRRLLDA